MSGRAHQLRDFGLSENLPKFATIHFGAMRCAARRSIEHEERRRAEASVATQGFGSI